LEFQKRHFGFRFEQRGSAIELQRRQSVNLLSNERLNRSRTSSSKARGAAHQYGFRTNALTNQRLELSFIESANLLYRHD
jgi:hypothetical protein